MYAPFFPRLKIYFLFIFSILTCAGECFIIIVPARVSVCVFPSEDDRTEDNRASIFVRSFTDAGVSLMAWFYDSVPLPYSTAVERWKTFMLCSRSLKQWFICLKILIGTWTSRMAEAVPKIAAFASLRSHFGNELLDMSSMRGARAHAHTSTRHPNQQDTRWLLW